MSQSAAETLAVTCPCGGHTLRLAPDKPPLGAKAAFTCPACGLRRTFTRTASGVAFDDVATAPSPPPARPVAKAPSLPAPTPVPPGAALVLTALPDISEGPAGPDGPDTPWVRAVAAAFPAPGWHVLPASHDARQIEADVRFHRPAVVLVADPAEGAGGDARAQALLTAVAALPGRAREAMTVIVLGAFATGDPLAAFGLGADVVLAVADTADAAARLGAARGATMAKPSYFRAEQG
ncbi:hypothetical protein [Solidesulfovibrio alcoholivorans]|uniref:hypothetical protein n=1 Tax=Solidesulfovibrio alcoholivorans TaxID=81406 RepID=UPI000694E2C7|nr:hypothetical protein [Solidesulfovibrio alcoholivorans]